MLVIDIFHSTIFMGVLFYQSLKLYLVFCNGSTKLVPRNIIVLLLFMLAVLFHSVLLITLTKSILKNNFLKTVLCLRQTSNNILRY
jgi:hypothetical protein